MDASDAGHDGDTDRGGRESWRQLVVDAAVEAELQTGVREDTLEQARRHVVWRLLGAVGGFVLIGAGIAMLPLPGPGWLVIILGLTMLPFRWADRTVTLIRRRIPGVPEEGSIPTRTWVVMGTLVVAFGVVSIVWGDDLRGFAAALWGDPDKLLG